METHTMDRFWQKLFKALLIMSCATLPSSFIECDMEDGELEIDFDDIADDFYIDVWYD